MTRTLSVLMVAGALVLVGCAKKQKKAEAEGGSLLNSSATSTEDDRNDRGRRDDDVTNEGRGGQSGPGDRLPR